MVLVFLLPSSQNLTNGKPFSSMKLISIKKFVPKYDNLVSIEIYIWYCGPEILACLKRKGGSTQI